MKTYIGCPSCGLNSAKYPHQHLNKKLNSSYNNQKIRL